MAGTKTVSAITACVIGAVLWGFIGLFTRNLDAAGFDPMGVTFLRMFIAMIILGIGLLVFDRKSFTIHRKDLWVFVLFAVFKILSDLLLFYAQLRIHLALSTVLQLTSPYWVLFLSVFLFGEKITAKKVVAICIAFTGCILVTGILQTDVSFDTIGVLFAIGSGISYALYTTGTKVLMNRGYTGNTTMFYIFLISVIMCIPFSAIETIPGKIDSLDVVWNIMAMGVLMTLVPYYLQIYALKYITPVKVNVIGLLEVVACVIVGYVFYNETLGPLNFVGMVLIPASIIVMNVDLRRRIDERDKEGISRI